MHQKLAYYLQVYIGLLIEGEFSSFDVEGILDTVAQELFGLVAPG